MHFLPFTRPDIDEETITAVAEVLRSGWITTGPKAREFEAALSSFVGGRPVRIVAMACCRSVSAFSMRCFAAASISGTVFMVSGL